MTIEWGKEIWAITIHNDNTSDELRILVFKGDPHAVDGERVLLILISVVMPGNVSLHCGDVCHILHTKRSKADKNNSVWVNNFKQTHHVTNNKPKTQ